MLSGIPNEWGPKFECNGGAVTRTHTGPNSIRFVAPAHMALIMFTAQPHRQIALNSDKKFVGIAPVGAIEIVPAQSELYAHWATEKQNLLVAVDPGRLKRLAGMEFDKEAFELHPPKLGIVDAQAHALARCMKSEVENIDIGYEESLDALVTLFATHLLRNYSSLRGRSQRQFNGGLLVATWRRITEYINGNLAETLTLERLASIANLSPSHFARAFRQTSGQSPHQYVISTRLAHARQLITGTDKPLSEVAKISGFSNNSHMTALMKRAYGTTPSDVRRQR